MGEELKIFGFATGETAPAIKYRTDIDKYLGSCRRLRNFDVDVTGAIVRRRGAQSLAEWIPSKLYDSVFFYSGNFIGERVLVVFYASEGILYASFCRIDAEVPTFVDCGSTDGVDMEVFRKESVRFRQYNDVLFLCGSGLPVCQVRFSSFSWTRPREITVYEDREEDPAQSKMKTARLVDEALGEYEWTYSVVKPFDNPDLTEDSLVGIRNDSSYYVSGFPTDAARKPRFTWDGSKLVVEVGSSSGEALPYLNVDSSGFNRRSEIAVPYPSSLFKTKSESHSYAYSDGSGPLRHVSMTLGDLGLSSDRCYSFDFEVKVRLTTQVVSTGEAGPYSETVSPGKIHLENLVYEETTARRVFDNKEGGVTLMKFPWTIPPTVGFVSMDGGEFKVSGNVLTYPSEGAVYDDKIPFVSVKASEVLALEQSSGESVTEDWGKNGASGAKAAGAVSDVYYASGNTTLYFFSAGGRWTGQLALQVSYDTPDVSNEDCTWIDVGYITAASDGTLSPAVTFKVNHYNARVRVKLLERRAARHYYYGETEGNYIAGSYSADMGCMWTLRITGERRFYFSKSSGGAETGATVTRLNVSPQEFTCGRYSVGAFRAATGYPLTMDVAQQRLWFFSTASYPKYFWASKVDDIANFSTGTEKDDGLCFEADSGTPDFARWLKYGKGQFQFGCTQSEGNLVGKDNEYSLNPTSLALENESAWGSADADALLLGEKIFYAKAGGKIIHAQVYDSGRARYVSGEVNVLARHLFTQGKRAVKLVGLRAPDTVLFVLREDGTLARFVFNDEQSVGAWSTYDFAKAGMKAQDVGVIYGDASDMLVIMFASEDGRYVFAGIDALSEEFLDFGDTDYESEVITNAMALDGENSYGGRGVIGKLDLYGSAGADCAFEVSFDGGRTYRAQYKGIEGEGYFSPESACRRISWSGGYSGEACVGVRTRCRGDFQLLAVGALIRRSDTASPPARDKDGRDWA